MDLIKEYINIINRVSTIDGDKKKHEIIVEKHEKLKNLANCNKGQLSESEIVEIFNSILLMVSKKREKNNKKELLITSKNIKFKSINEMFGLSTNKPIIIAGPCAIENKAYLDQVAEVLCMNNIKFLRAGSYKPRTSPYDFSGLREEGLHILKEIRNKYDLITVTEVLDTRDVELVAEFADILQIGSRNMQNFELLKEVGRLDKPVLLKRGFSATLEEFMLAAEYIALQGNRNIILCERGIRTYETSTRNTLDISSVPIIKQETNLPIIVDLSHSLGRKDIIKPIAKAAIAVGADGIMVEVHPQPELALSDSNQQLNLDEFNDLILELGIK